MTWCIIRSLSKAAQRHTFTALPPCLPVPVLRVVCHDTCTYLYLTGRWQCSSSGLFRSCVWRKLRGSVNPWFDFDGHTKSSHYLQDSSQSRPRQKKTAHSWMSAMCKSHQVCNLDLVPLRPFISRCGVSWKCMILIRRDRCPCVLMYAMSKSEHLCVMRSHTTFVVI